MMKIVCNLIMFVGCFYPEVNSDVMPFSIFIHGFCFCHSPLKLKFSVANQSLLLQPLCFSSCCSPIWRAFSTSFQLLSYSSHCSESISNFSSSKKSPWFSMTRHFLSTKFMISCLHYVHTLLKRFITFCFIVVFM